MDKMIWRVLGTLAVVGATAGARKLIDTGWVATTGKRPPENPQSPDTDWKEAALWAVASGAVIGLVRLAAERNAASVYRAAVGELPQTSKKKDKKTF